MENKVVCPVSHLGQRNGSRALFPSADCIRREDFVAVSDTALTHLVQSVVETIRQVAFEDNLSILLVRSGKGSANYEGLRRFNRLADSSNADMFGSIRNTVQGPW
jgi:hypothetical protein